MCSRLISGAYDLHMSSWLTHANTTEMWDSASASTECGVATSHVLWRRHGGARTRYTRRSEMGWKQKERERSDCCSPQTQRSRKCWRVRAEVCCSDVSERGSSLAAREHGSVLLACWEPKQSRQVPPPVPWRSKARRSVRRLSVCPHTSPLWLARPPAAGSTGGRVELCCHTQAAERITVSNSALQMGSIHLIFIKKMKIFMEFH